MGKMHRLALCCALLTGLCLAGAVSSPAATVTFDLNWIVEVNNPIHDPGATDHSPASTSLYSQGGSFGTITLSDWTLYGSPTGQVAMWVDLVPNEGILPSYIKSIYLNYAGMTSYLNITGQHSIVTEGEDSKLGNDYEGKFDVKVVPYWIGAFEPYQDKLSATIFCRDVPLSAELFRQTDTGGSDQLFAMVNVGLYDGKCGCIWVGSREIVPVPQTALLLGSGLLGLLGFRKRGRTS